MVQSSVPNSDYYIGDWSKSPGGSTTDIYQNIDNTIPGNSDNIQYQNAPVGTGYLAVFNASSLTDPDSSSDHEYKYVVGAAGFGGSIDVLFGLATGANVNDIISSVTTGVTTDFSATAKTGSFTLSTSEADSISDYSSLYFFISGLANGFGNYPVVYEVEFQVPDAGGGGGGEGPKLNPEAFLMFL
jgi:hypothetical protein